MDSKSDTGSRPSRLRTLTDRGRQAYDETLGNFVGKLGKIKHDIEEETLIFETNSYDRHSLPNIRIRLEDECHLYEKVSTDFIIFLTRTNTTESKRELASQNLIINSVKSRSHTILERMNQTILESNYMFTTANSSHKASASSFHSSQRTTTSSTNSLLLRQKAKVSAARAKLDYASQEAELKKQMTILSAKREAAVADAELQAMYEELSNSSPSHNSRKSRVSQKETHERVSQYIENQAQQDHDEYCFEENYPDSIVVSISNQSNEVSSSPKDRVHIPTQGESTIQSHNTDHSISGGESTIQNHNTDNSISEGEGHPISTTKIPTQPTIPRNFPENVKETEDSKLCIEGLSNFLMRKELITSRLTKFDDKAESFLAWKSTFMSVMKEMKVTASEEIDLLIKWLGQESGKHAVSVKNTSAYNYTKGLQNIWDRLDERYGSVEMIENALKHKLSVFPKLTHKDKKKLYELSDLLSEIQTVKENPKYTALLSYFDTASGVNPVVLKLPVYMQNKWRDRALRYKKEKSVSFPPFNCFVDFILDMARMMNDPGFNYEGETSNSTQKSDKQSTYRKVSAAKTGVSVQTFNTSKATSAVSNSVNTGPVPRCIIHKANHSLNKCRVFKEMSLEDKHKMLKENGICFKCLDSNQHTSRQCPITVTCNECGGNHNTMMHSTKPPRVSNFNISQPHGGERHAREQDKVDNDSSQNSQLNMARSSTPTAISPLYLPVSSGLPVVNKCTEICKTVSEFSGKSCAKIVPVNIYHRDIPNKCVKIYAILDEQSNKSLAKKELFDRFGIHSQQESYTLSTCSGSLNTTGRRSKGFVIESLDGHTRLDLPTIIECEGIPNNRNEIPTPEVAMYHPHLESIAHQLFPLDYQSDILLLIGRDLMEAHHIQEQRIGPPNKPYAQKLGLGWVIIGETCLGGAHIPDTVNTFRTYVTMDGRPSILKPCESEFVVDEIQQKSATFTSNSIGSTVFVRTMNDDSPGMSIEDKRFLKIMDDECFKGQDGHWVAPLPFRENRPRLPNNRSHAMKRAHNLTFSLKKDSVKKEHFLAFMEELLINKHAELAPALQTPTEECWYLPLFGVYHPKKKDQIRCVFDSSAKHGDISLNDVLLTGPDLVNNLVGVLIRFRKEKVAITADIQKMFYCFLVKPEHRNFLRFLWHKNNDIDMELVDYGMRVHVFGNSPSPAVATYCLRKTAEVSKTTYGTDVKDFVCRNFYVDDALSSHSSSTEAIDLLKRTQACLKENGNLRLHKISSSSEEVLSAFPMEDLSKDLMDLDFQADSLPLQRSLRLTWDIKIDTFKFLIAINDKPFTRRGVLSVLNSIFDPLGFLAPVTIRGKSLLRKFMSSGLDWDDTFQVHDYEEWRKWIESLECLEDLRIPRTYVNTSPLNASRCELHVFSDASESAIAAVSYLRVFDKDGVPYTGFLFGKAKLAPTHGHTIPRLELCAAVMAVEMTSFTLEQLDLEIDIVKYYTDSRVVLGYIQNETRRFYIYVGNRVDIIRKFSLPSQWNYIPTSLNPADLGTRSIPACELQDSVWLHGPTSFFDRHTECETCESHDLITPELDKEIRPTEKVSVLTSSIQQSNMDIGTKRFERFSTWNSLVRAIMYLKGRIKNTDTRNVEGRLSTEKFVLKSVQREMYMEEILCLQRKECIPKNSSILSLDPYLDQEGLLRVGGRLRKMSADITEKNPVILPGKNHVSTLLVLHYHAKVKHMGRHFTDGAIRSAGIWITGVKRLINSLLHKCVTCKLLRGRFQSQKMADLPPDRLQPAPPFTNVGVDVFGPWLVSARKTRGGQANAKRWAVLFSCLVTRAIHIEVIEEMTSSAFINALRRFIALRGNVTVFRSDRGTNFIGATKDLRIDTINVEDGPIKNFLFNAGTVWIFNPPHSSHMGGAWERMIGITRRILDSMLSEIPNKKLTHDVLVTLMAEVCSIVNARPLVPVSTDIESPFVLSPATLLTMKSEHSVKSFTANDFNIKDLYKSQWRQVQYLSNLFWSRWRKEYLYTLQKRRKWSSSIPSLKKGDVVLLKDSTLHRNEWPLGIVENAFLSDDGLVRKIEVRITKDGKSHVYTRPVTEIVLIVSDSE